MAFLMIVAIFIFTFVISFYQAFCIKWSLGFFDIDFHIRQVMAFVLASEFFTSALYVMLATRIDNIKTVSRKPTKAFKDSFSIRVTVFFSFTMILIISFVSSKIINLFWS